MLLVGEDNSSESSVDDEEEVSVTGGGFGKRLGLDVVVFTAPRLGFESAVCVDECDSKDVA